MDINNLTIGEAKKLATLLSGLSSTAPDCCHDCRPVIVCTGWSATFCETRVPVTMMVSAQGAVGSSSQGFLILAAASDAVSANAGETIASVMASAVEPRHRFLRTAVLVCIKKDPPFF